MRYLQFLGQRFQVIVNPSRKQRRFHGAHPGPRPLFSPRLQIATLRRNRPLVEDASILRFGAEADCLFVDIESDIVDSSHWVLLTWFLSQPTAGLSRIVAQPSGGPHHLYIQTIIPHFSAVAICWT